MDGAGVPPAVTPCDWLDVEVGILAGHMGIRADFLPITVKDVSSDILVTTITMKCNIASAHKAVMRIVKNENWNIKRSFKIKKGKK